MSSAPVIGSSIPADARVYVAGHAGMVGSALYRRLQATGHSHLITRELDELDLRDGIQVEKFFSDEKPQYVFLAAAKVGGIWANNTYPADFIYENLAIQIQVIEACRRHGVEGLLFLGSSCIYPKLAPQPIREDSLLTGPLEPTNQPYALAKIAGVEMCQAYARQHGMKSVCLMPTNLFGPGDNYHPENSHVMAAMIRKFHEAKVNKGTVTLWGTGSPMREFLYVDDLSEGALFLMDRLAEGGIRSGELINVGVGVDLTIKELSETVAKVVGFDGEVVWDSSKPDGTPRKLLDVSRLNGLGWKAKTGLEDGIRLAYEWFLANRA